MAHPPSAVAVSPAPWWKFGHVWLVLSGPALVVVASCATFYLAARGQDPVVVNQALGAGSTASLAPAKEARNHAATGVQAKR